MSARLFVLRRQIRAAWPAGLWALGLLAAAAVGGLLGGTAEARIRWAGAVLQVGGIGVALWALRSVVENIIHWLGQLSLRTVEGRVDAVVADAQADVLAPGVTSGADPELLRRLSALEDRTALLQLQLEKLWQGLLDESRLREQGDRAIRQLSEAARRGYSLQWVGLLWIAVGVICTSVSSEIAACFQ